jgi:hypothetical protein
MIPTSIEPAFLELMPSTVTINSVSSTNEYGIRTFGSSTTVSCRIQKSSRLVITEDGKQVPEEGRVYCYGTATVTVNDKLTLPDNTVVPILSVETRNNEAGAFVTVISFGRA